MLLNPHTSNIFYPSTPLSYLPTIFRHLVYPFTRLPALFCPTPSLVVCRLIHPSTRWPSFIPPPAVGSPACCPHPRLPDPFRPRRLFGPRRPSSAPSPLTASCLLLPPPASFERLPTLLIISSARLSGLFGHHKRDRGKERKSDRGEDTKQQAKIAARRTDRKATINKMLTSCPFDCFLPLPDGLLWSSCSARSAARTPGKELCALLALAMSVRDCHREAGEPGKEWDIGAKKSRSRVAEEKTRSKITARRIDGKATTKQNPHLCSLVMV